MDVPTNPSSQNGKNTPLLSLSEWQARVAKLTPRQREVVRHIAEGCPNKATANKLCISIKTVGKHRQWAYKTLNVYNTAMLVRVAIMTGIVPPYLPVTPLKTGKETEHAKLPNPRA